MCSHRYSQTRWNASIILQIPHAHTILSSLLETPLPDLVKYYRFPGSTCSQSETHWKLLQIPLSHEHPLYYILHSTEISRYSPKHAADKCGRCSPEPFLWLPARPPLLHPYNIHRMVSQASTMDRPGVRKVPEGSGEQGKMEKTGCKIICGQTTGNIWAPKYYIFPIDDLPHRPP